MTAEDQIQQGLADTEGGKFPEALACFQAALKIDPTSAHAWYCLGCTFNQLGDRAEAAKAFLACTRYEPYRKEGWYNLGNCLQELGQLKEAEDCFAFVVELDPADADSWINLGRLIDDRGDHQAAVACYDRAIPLAPGDVIAWTNRGNSLASLGRGHEAEAEKSYRRAMELDPTFALARLAYGKMLVSQGRPADAIPVLTEGAKLVASSPNNATETWLYLALALARLKRSAEASAALDQARACARDNPRDNQSPDLWNNIGEVYFMAGNYAKALFAYDTASQKAPGYYRACYGKARSHLMLGQKAQAKQACQQYLAAAAANDSLVPAVQKLLAMCD